MDEKVGTNHTRQAKGITTWKETNGPFSVSHLAAQGTLGTGHI